jgi:hypothetical protein
MHGLVEVRGWLMVNYGGEVVGSSWKGVECEPVIAKERWRWSGGRQRWPAWSTRSTNAILNTQNNKIKINKIK